MASSRSHDRRSWRALAPARRTVRLVLAFDAITEFALTLLSVPPDELEALGWSFADRKRLLDHFLRSGKAAQRVPRDAPGQSLITLRLPQRDLAPLQRFARRELPKAASNAAMLGRVLRVLDEAA